MNLPKTATQLQPEDWLKVMTLISPDNVDETLRVLHLHEYLIELLERCRNILSAMPGSTLEADIERVLAEKSKYDMQPWPIESAEAIEPQEEEPSRA